MLSPTARGPLSEAVLEAMRSGETAGVADLPPPEDADDAQLTLWCLYELHHRGFDDVADEHEWDPQLIALRQRLEADLEQQLRERAPEPPRSEEHTSELQSR